MSFLKKIAKVAKGAVKAYATYQTGGLSGLATSAISKAAKGNRRMVPMLQPMGGINVIPAAFSGARMGNVMGSIATGIGTAADVTTILNNLPSWSGPAYNGGGIVGRGTKEMRKALARAAHAAGGRKKYRRINPSNVKALRRSIRRIHGAEKLFRQVLSVQGKHHAGIKTKRGKR